MDGLVIAIFLSVYTSHVLAGYCPETHTEYKICSRAESYDTRCGFIGWGRCTEYKTVTYTCTELVTLYPCCSGWDGNKCSNPICYGSKTCPNGGTCQSPDTCSCKTGFSSPKCADIDECLNGNGGCQHICTNTHGSYGCSCRSGYVLDSDFKSCIDINECNVNNGGCQQTCENLPGTYRCNCNPGYLLNNDGTSCRDEDECARDVCQHDCTNTVGSFSCSCRSGYSLALNKLDCNDVDECLDKHVCDHQCHNTEGSYRCSCNAGYSLLADRASCSDIDECDEDNGNCESTCENLPGSYFCTCPAGYTLNEDQRACDDIDECALEISGCSDDCSNTVGSFVCSCPPGFYIESDNRTCEDIDDCEGIYCSNRGTCVDGLMSFVCNCQEGYEGELCEKDRDECGVLNGGCQDICTNSEGSFRCSCNDDRKLKSDGVSCTGSSPTVSVFQTHSIIGKVLPRGCWTTTLTAKNTNLTLSSTSQWYMLGTDHPKSNKKVKQETHNTAVVFSHGIVFEEVNELAIPISLEGVEIQKTPGNFKIAHGVSVDNEESGIDIGLLRTENCLNFVFTPSDMFEFIQAGSFMNSLFESLMAALPNWVHFVNAGTNSVRVEDLRTSLLYGTDIKDDYRCKGAPVFPEHIYSVLKFESSFELDIYGQTIEPPSLLSGEKFCLIIDMCQSCGATVFLMLPEGSRGLLSKINSFKTLFENNGFYIEPRGIGLSFGKEVNVHHQKSQLTLWNGDDFFNYPITGHANFWLGGDVVYESSSLTAKGQTDVFLSVPSIDRILTGVFIDEWNGLVSMKAMASTVLKFKLFGTQHQIELTDMIKGSIDTYMSLGGTEERILCGQTANPSGIFLSARLTINPFVFVPIMKDWILDSSHEVYAFFMTDPAANLHKGVPIDIENDIINLNGVLNGLKDYLIKVYDDVKGFIVSSISKLIQNVATAVGKVILLLQNLNGMVGENLKMIMDVIGEVWESIRTLEGDASTFIDSADLFVDILSDSVTTTVGTEIETVKAIFSRIMQKLNNQVSSLVDDYHGFGLKYHVTVTLFGLNLPELDIEFVYSTRMLFACSRFDTVYELLKGKPAARFLARVSQEKEIKLGRFFKITGNTGVGIGMAFAIESDEVVAQLEVFASFLGARVTADLFITNQHLALYIELNVWNIFLAQVDVIADHGRDWYDLTLQIRGRFVAKTRDSFENSYLGALIECLRLISNEAKKRLSQVQNTITTAQTGLTKAQNWLEMKIEDVVKANQNFDNAVESLERAKQKLEEAKEPYKNMIKKLEEAQRKVDNLCKIRTCRKICIPGLKCKICKKKIGWVNIPYPCCKFTSCMISVPDPICVLANLLCRAVRALAYLALEAAKMIVRTVMLAYDVAKLAVSFAQVIVDKSRFVLDVAEGILSLAQLGLEGAKGVLEAAKVAVELVKIAIGFAAKVLEYVIQYGIKALIDVRSCGFDIELSTTDLPVFDISCEVNLFKLGWNTIGIRINFKNVFQSIWQAAKATVKTVLNGFGHLLSGRKRREITFHSTSIVHTFLRNVRSAESIGVNATQQTADAILDTLPLNEGFTNETYSDYENRVNVFEQKCLSIVNVLNFMKETFGTLFDIANETYTDIEASIAAQNDLQKYNVTDLANNMTFQGTGVDVDAAMQDYNITQTELDEILNSSKAEATNDLLLSEIISMVELSSESINEEIAGAESVQIVNLWLIAMENTTRNYFNDTECFGYRDCVHHSIALLYDLYTEEDLPEIENIQSTISSLEDYIVDVFQNFSSSISETFNASSTIMNNIQFLADSNLFCSSAPIFVTTLENYTATVGSDVVMRCHVSADPAPTFWWYRDGDFVPGQSGDTVLIPNVTADSAAVYQCTVGNIVANITSREAHVIIINSTETVTDNFSDDDLLVIVLAPSIGAVVILGIAAATVYFLLKRHSKPTLRNIRVWPVDEIPNKDLRSLRIHSWQHREPSMLPDAEA